MLTFRDYSEEFYEICIGVTFWLSLCLIQWFAWWLYSLKGKICGKPKMDRMTNYWEYLFQLLNLEIINIFKESLNWIKVWNWYKYSLSSEAIFTRTFACSWSPPSEVQDLLLKSSATVQVNPSVYFDYVGSI